MGSGTDQHFALFSLNRLFLPFFGVNVSSDLQLPPSVSYLLANRLHPLTFIAVQKLDAQKTLSTFLLFSPCMEKLHVFSCCQSGCRADQSHNCSRVMSQPMLAS